MEHLIRSLKLAWRSEHLLRKNEFQLGARKLQINALAGLVAVFALVMLSLAVFFALVPYWGQSLAALTVGIIDLVLAGVLAAYAGSLKPAADVEIIKEVRDMALSDIEEEIALAEAELVSIRQDVRRLLHNPLDVLLPGAIVPLLNAITRGLGAAKK